MPTKPKQTPRTAFDGFMGLPYGLSQFAAMPQIPGLEGNMPPEATTYHQDISGGSPDVGGFDPMGAAPVESDFDKVMKVLGPLLVGQQSNNGSLDALKLLFPRDTVGDRNKAWTDVGPGGGFDQAKAAGFFGPELSPTAKLASQGASAQNQWAQLGQAPGIDPNELKGLMDKRAAASAPLAGFMSQPPGQVTGRFGYESQLPQGVSQLPNDQGGFDLVGPAPDANGVMGGGNRFGWSSGVTPPPQKKKPVPFGGFFR